MGLQLRLENVSHEYGRTDDAVNVRALQNVELEIAAGDFAVLMGESGSGKSTLLNLLGGIDRPTSGRIFLGPTEISGLPERELTKLRRGRIGFIFQFFNLVPTLTVRENVEFPLALAGVSSSASSDRVAAILDEIGLRERASHYPNQLSGGEMQRAAIGRAVIHHPDLILADEPTGNLDSRTGDMVLELIRRIHRHHTPTIVMATHSEHAASFGQYVIEVQDGKAARRNGAP